MKNLWLALFLGFTTAAVAADKPAETPPTPEYKFEHLTATEAQAILNILGGISTADAHKAGIDGLFVKLNDQAAAQLKAQPPETKK